MLSSRDYRRLQRVTQQKPKIEYCKLMEEAGIKDPGSTYLCVSQRTIQQVMAEQGYCKFIAKRRLKINKPIAILRH
jgi:hypothetical protein